MKGGVSRWRGSGLEKIAGKTHKFQIRRGQAGAKTTRQLHVNRSLGPSAPRFTKTKQLGGKIRLEVSSVFLEENVYGLCPTHVVPRGLNRKAEEKPA